MSTQQTSHRSLLSSGLAVASSIVMILETFRATNAIAHDAEFGGLSFVGLALPGPLIAVGGPMAATFGLIGIAFELARARLWARHCLGFCTGVLRHPCFGPVPFPRTCSGRNRSRIRLDDGMGHDALGLDVVRRHRARAVRTRAGEPCQNSLISPDLAERSGTARLSCRLHEGQERSARFTQLPRTADEQLRLDLATVC